MTLRGFGRQFGFQPLIARLERDDNVGKKTLDDLDVGAPGHPSAAAARGVV